MCEGSTKGEGREEGAFFHLDHFAHCEGSTGADIRLKNRSGHSRARARSKSRGRSLKFKHRDSNARTRNRPKYLNNELSCFVEPSVTDLTDDCENFPRSLANSHEGGFDFRTSVGCRFIPPGYGVEKSYDGEQIYRPRTGRKELEKEGGREGAT